MTIAYSNRKPVAPHLEHELGAAFMSLDELLSTSDVVSINCPYSPATHHLISTAQFELMRPTAFLVNTARGPIVDEAALVHALQHCQITGAGLDVFEHEPAVNPKLLKLAKAGKVVLLPHMGSATIEGRVDMGEKVIINIKTFMDGHRPPDRVLPSML